MQGRPGDQSNRGFLGISADERWAKFVKSLGPDRDEGIQEAAPRRKALHTNQWLDAPRAVAKQSLLIREGVSLDSELVKRDGVEIMLEPLTEGVMGNSTHSVPPCPPPYSLQLPHPSSLLAHRLLYSYRPARSPL